MEYSYLAPSLSFSSNHQLLPVGLVPYREMLDEFFKMKNNGIVWNTVPYTVNNVRWDANQLVNKVEQGNLKQTTEELSFG